MKTKLTLFVTVCAASLLGVGCASTDDSTASKAVPSFVNEGLVAYYPFNGDAQDATGNSLEGIVTDNSGNGIHLVNVGAKPAPDRHGKPDKALQFSGKEYLRFGRKLSDMPKQTTTAWVNTENTAEKMGTIFSDLTPHGGNDLIFWVSPTGGRVRADKSGGVLGVDGDPTGGLFVFPESNRPGKDWFHVVWVLEEKSSKIYLNGEQTAEITATGSNVGYHQAETGRWDHRFGARDYFKGAMDDIRIYNRALSAKEVEALYNLEKP